MNDLVQQSPQANQLVPAGYAEKAMASIMQLHSELMDEKERRVDLYRKLMEREQALAELKMYVRLLEEKTSGAESKPAVPAPAPPTDLTLNEPPQRVQTQAKLRPPVPPQVNARPMPDGWKTW